MTFVCSTCKVDVPVDEKVSHVRSDWHVYNLKRVVSGLPPISQEIFLHKKQLIDSEVPEVKRETYCSACKKCFSNSKSFDAHLTSKRHLHNSSFCRREHPATDTTESTAENSPPQPLPLGSCLFCDRIVSLNSLPNESLDKTQQIELAKRVLNHMFDAHKFTVPFPEKLTDPAGLLIELGRIVGEERACLFCGRQFYGSRVEKSNNAQISLSAVRNHMLDKPGHKQLWCGTEDPVQTALLIAEAEEEESDEDSAENYPKVGLAGGELFSQFYDQSVVVSPFLLSDDEDVYEVRLPSGTVLGHRKMKTVYKQHLSSTSSITTSTNNNAAYLTNHTGNNQKTVSILQNSDLKISSAQKRDRADCGRHLNDQRKYWDLTVGLQSNLCSRMRLRRPY
ncbi:unnamed protein product [Trichobilharzia szidati]|nr:unnamed protein product [Trichobilharzia szidati]